MSRALLPPAALPRLTQARQRAAAAARHLAATAPEQQQRRRHCFLLLTPSALKCCCCCCCAPPGPAAPPPRRRCPLARRGVAAGRGAAHAPKQEERANNRQLPRFFPLFSRFVWFFGCSCRHRRRPAAKEEDRQATPTAPADARAVISAPASPRLAAPRRRGLCSRPALLPPPSLSTLCVACGRRDARPQRQWKKRATGRAGGPQDTDEARRSARAGKRAQGRREHRRSSGAGWLSSTRTEHGVAQRLVEGEGLPDGGGGGGARHDRRRVAAARRGSRSGGGQASAGSRSARLRVPRGSRRPRPRGRFSRRPRPRLPEVSMSARSFPRAAQRCA